MSPIGITISYDTGYQWDHSSATGSTHLVSKGEHLPFQVAMLLFRLLQLSLLTRQLLLQAQELLKDKQRHTHIMHDVTCFKDINRCVFMNLISNRRTENIRCVRNDEETVTFLTLLHEMNRNV